MTDVNALKALVDAGTIVCALAGVVALWKAYNARIDAHIADLRKLAFKEQPLPPRNNPHLPHREFAPSLN